MSLVSSFPKDFSHPSASIVDRIDGIYVSYAVVIGVHRVILFDNLHNVQGFIVKGSILSVHEAGPELSAHILEPLRVPSYFDHDKANSSVSPPCSTCSGTTISSQDNSPVSSPIVKAPEESPDPSPELLLSAPEYVPNKLQRVAQTQAQMQHQAHEQHKQRELEEQQEYCEEKDNSIVSFVGGRVAMIPSIASIKQSQPDVPRLQLPSKYSSNYVQYSYSFLRKSNMKKKQSGLKRSQTTFETRPRRRPRRTRCRSQSCGTLTSVTE